jgi:hypothetical protein
MLPNIRVDAINAPIELAQGSTSYAGYTTNSQMAFYEGLDGLRRVTFIAFVSLMGWRISTFRLAPSPIALNRKATICQWFNYKKLLNDLVTDSFHLGRVRSAPTPTDNHGGSRVDLLRSALFKTLRSRAPSAFNAAKDMVVVEVLAIMVEEVGFLQAIAELI